MADLRITELAALAGIDLTAGDFLAVADISASETKKITIQDAIGYGVTLIADASIPGTKILFSAGQISATALASNAVTTAKLTDDAVTAVKLADESTVDLVTSLPLTGAFVGQLALDTDDLKVYCWDGSIWQSIKAAGSINSVTGDATGTINIVVTQTGSDVTISATLDSTSAAAQFLAGPTASAGSVSYRTIAAGDLPTATTNAKGAVQVNGSGLTMNGDIVQIDNTVTANNSAYHVVQYTSKGLVTGGRTIQSGDLPLAGASSVGGVYPGSGLTVAVTGQLNHTNAVTAGTYPKITYDAQGHVTGGASLDATDIPNIPATKLTSGTINTDVIGTKSITSTKLADYATVKFGGASSTSGVVTFPVPEFTGQQFFDANNGDLYLYDGNTWQPITVISGDLVYGGTYAASTNTVKSVTTQGSAVGLVVNNALPAASSSNLRYYVVVADSGTGASPAPTVALAPPDMLVSNGATWDLVDVSSAIAGQTATNISFIPYGNIAATNAQTAIQELDDEKLAKAGGIVTGNLEIGTTGSLSFEGATSDAFETTLGVVDPTADRSILLPNSSGTLITTGDSGVITSAMIADGTITNADISASAAIVDTKLATISTAGKVSNSATTATNANTASTIVARDANGDFVAGTVTATGFSGSGASLTSLTAGNLSGTIPSGVLGNSTAYVGTTALALNRASANQSLTGILSVAMPGATSGTITITPAATAGTTAITVPATTGTLVTTGDSGTVTSTMIADGTIVNGDINASAAIADTKLATISTAGKVSGTAITSGNISTSGSIATTSTLAVGQSSAAANTDFDLAGTYAQTLVAVSALDIDCSTGNYFTKTINANSTFTVSNVPASRAFSFTLELTHTSGTITWFSGVVWPGGTAPTLTTGKVHLFMFVTSNGGTTWRASSLINY